MGDKDSSTGETETVREWVPKDVGDLTGAEIDEIVHVTWPAVWAAMRHQGWDVEVIVIYIYI